MREDSWRAHLLRPSHSCTSLPSSCSAAALSAPPPPPPPLHSCAALARPVAGEHGAPPATPSPGGHAAGRPAVSIVWSCCRKSAPPATIPAAAAAAMASSAAWSSAAATAGAAAAPRGTASSRLQKGMTCGTQGAGQRAVDRAHAPHAAAAQASRCGLARRGACQGCMYAGRQLPSVLLCLARQAHPARARSSVGADPPSPSPAPSPACGTPLPAAGWTPPWQACAPAPPPPPRSRRSGP